MTGLGHALTPPFTVAALVLCAAGVAKLRAPKAAVAAARAVLPFGAGTFAVRGLGLLELALGIASVLGPARPLAAAMAVLYAAFALLALRLAAQAQACGCFGSAADAASPLQAAISAVLAGVASVSVLAPPDALATLVRRAPGTGIVITLAAVAGAYAVTVAYRELPRAWRAWSPG